MKYVKISGTFLKFSSSQRIETGASYASHEMRLSEHEIIVRTYGHGKTIETKFLLEGPQYLDFTARSNDVSVPDITGHFFNSDYEDCILSASLPDQKVNISGVVTKMDELHGLSTKTVTDASSGKVLGIMQERIEIISEADFKAAINQEQTLLSQH